MAISFFHGCGRDHDIHHSTQRHKQDNSTHFFGTSARAVDPRAAPQPCVEKAATSIGIYTVTASRIWKTAEFKAGYRKARGEAYSQTVARLQPSGAAVSTRLKVRVGKTTPPASRRRAVDCVQDRAAKSMELEDIEDLAALERAADRSKSENWV